jgi:hypothetical protein
MPTRMGTNVAERIQVPRMEARMKTMIRATVKAMTVLLHRVATTTQLQSQITKQEAFPRSRKKARSNTFHQSRLAGR